MTKKINTAIQQNSPENMFEAISILRIISIILSLAVALPEQY